MNLRQTAILESLADLHEQNDWPTWKCAAVISGAIDRLEHCREESQSPDELFSLLYQDLIKLAREGDLLGGQGDLGLDGGEPADARNTECYLTEAGSNWIKHHSRTNK